MKIVVSGSRLTDANMIRSLNASDQINKRLDMLPAGSIIITSGANGADQWAHQHAEQTGHRTIVIKADWDNEGRKAGILRNLRMLDQNPDLVLAFWDGESRGTRHTISAARRRGIPVEIIRI